MGRAHTAQSKQLDTVCSKAVLYCMREGGYSTTSARRSAVNALALQKPRFLSVSSRSSGAGLLLAEKSSHQGPRKQQPDFVRLQDVCMRVLGSLLALWSDLVNVCHRVLKLLSCGVECGSRGDAGLQARSLRNPAHSLRPFKDGVALALCTAFCLKVALLAPIQCIHLHVLYEQESDLSNKLATCWIQAESRHYAKFVLCQSNLCQGSLCQADQYEMLARLLPL